MRLTMVLVLVIAAVAFSYGGIGFGTGALQVIAEEPAAPMVLTVFGGIDLGSYQVGARAVGFSWHTGYPEGEQTYVGMGLVEAGIHLDDATLKVAGGWSDIQGSDDAGNPCYGVVWSMPLHEVPLQADLIVLESFEPSEPMLYAATMSLRF